MTTSVSAPPAEPAIGGAPAARTGLAARGGPRRRLLLRLVSLIVLGVLWTLGARAVSNPALRSEIGHAVRAAATVPNGVPA